MLCWLPAGPGGCSVAGRDQTGTQSIFSLSLSLSLFYYYLLSAFLCRLWTCGSDQSKARQYSRPIVCCCFPLFFGCRRPSAILNWNSRLFIILTLLSANSARHCFGLVLIDEQLIFANQAAVEKNNKKNFWLFLLLFNDEEVPFGVAHVLAAGLFSLALVSAVVLWCMCVGSCWMCVFFLLGFSYTLT